MIPKLLLFFSEISSRIGSFFNRLSGLLRRFISVKYSLDWNNAILVYQPGKVASSSIKKALDKVYKGPVVHLHSFERDHGEHSLNRERKNLRQKGDLPKVKIISLVRDPLSRNLSAFFQNLHKFQNEKMEFDGSCYPT